MVTDCCAMEFCGYEFGAGIPTNRRKRGFCGYEPDAEMPTNRGKRDYVGADGNGALIIVQQSLLSLLSE